MPAALLDQEEVQVANAGDESQQDEQAANRGKHLQRPIHRIRADDRSGRIDQVMRQGFHQPRWPGLRVGAHGDVLHRQAVGAGLDERLQGVGIIAEHQGAQGGLAADGPEAAGGVGGGDA